MRIAFFGGSFDPPHLGHLAIARAARDALALDRVLFAPVGLQPLKPAGSSASFEDRAAMVDLAIGGEPGFLLSLLDAPKAGQTAPNYTFDTLTRLRESYPGDLELFLLLGADSLRTFHHWYRAAEIPFLAELIVAARPNEPLAELQSLMPPGITIKPDEGNAYRLVNAGGAQSRLTLLPDLHYEISATELRRALRDGSAVRQIPAAVLAYIREHGLYK
jgi:nicotinate-nucleotide adenylyltransferase